MKTHLTKHSSRGFAALVAILLLLADAMAPAQAAGPGVHGRVLALGEQGDLLGTVAGATIQFENQAGQVVARVTADANGYYKVDLPPGVYRYTLKAPGYKDEDVGRGLRLILSDGYAVHDFSLTKGQNDPGRKPPVIPPVPVGKLQGRVLEKTDRGRLVGIPGAMVALRASPGDRQLFRVRTRQADKEGENAGKYEIVLAAGAWNASASAPGFETFADPQPVQIADGRTETRDFILRRDEAPTGQGIQGRILIRDPNASAAAPAQVKIEITSRSDPGSPVQTLQPGSKGSYRRDLRPGVYQVTASLDGYRTARSPARGVYPDKYTTVNLVLRPIAQTKEPPVEVAVFEEAKMRGGKQPLAGAEVLVRKEGEPLDKAVRGTTDASGKVKLKVVAVGPYQVIARKPEYDTAATKLNVTLAGPNRAVLSLKTGPEPSAKLLVTVVENARQGDRPVPGARIEIQRDGRTEATGESDNAGSFQGPPLERGRYRVLVGKPGYTPSSQDVAIGTANVRKRVELTAAAPQALLVEATIFEQSNIQGGKRPLAGARVRLRKPSEPFGTAVAGTSDVAGKVTLKVTAAGPYQLLADKPEYQIADTNLTVTAAGPNRVEVVLERKPESRARMLVTVVSRSPRGIEPAPGARVDIRRGVKPVVGGQSDSHGLYESPPLESGNYRLLVSKSGYAPSSQDVAIGTADVHERAELTAAESESTLQVQVLGSDDKGTRRPVARAEVALLSGRKQVSTQTTDREGRCNFKGLRHGDYELDVRHESFASARERVAVDQPVVKQTILFRRPPPLQATVTLTVFGQTPGLRPQPVPRAAAPKPVAMRPLPLAGAEVTVLARGHKKPVAQGRTDKAGRYEVRLMPGDYRFSVTMQDYQPGSVDLTVGNEDVQQRIVLKPIARPEPRPGPR